MKITKPKLIPLWKWILLYFRPVNISFAAEDDIACIIYTKELFKEIYIIRKDYFRVSTGDLLRTCKLTRSRK